MNTKFSSELELPISSDSIQLYTQVAQKHLQKHNATVSVECAGQDEFGRNIFGICLRSDNGDEEWYDPYDIGDILAGWTDEHEARQVLEMKVLPNLGYAIYQLDLKLFHQNMINE